MVYALLLDPSQTVHRRMLRAVDGVGPVAGGERLLQSLELRRRFLICFHIKEKIQSTGLIQS